MINVNPVLCLKKNNKKCKEEESNGDLSAGFIIKMMPCNFGPPSGLLPVCFSFFFVYFQVA